MKSVYGIYDLVVIFESDNLQQVKSEIDERLPLIDGVENMMDVDGLFVEMGSKINLDFVKHLIKLNTKGEIEVTDGGKTTHPAIFASGDATNIPYKQIVAACGDGAAAGISAFNYIEKLKGKPGIRSDWN